MEDIIPDYSYYLFFNQKENLNQLLDKFSHMFNNDRETALKGLFQVIYMVPRYNTKLECIIKPYDYTNTNLNDEYPGVSQHDWQLLTEIPNQPIFFIYNNEQKKFILNKI